MFDRWVIQSQDDPSIEEVSNWCSKANLKIYSIYPFANTSFLGNSIFHPKICDPYSFKNLFSIPEITWMMQTDEDQTFLENYNELMADTHESLKELSNIMANFQKKSVLDPKSFSENAEHLNMNLSKVDLLSPMKLKLNTFLNEANLFIKTVEKGDLNKLKNVIDDFSILFNGAVGVRHVDFIAYKSL